MSYGQNPWPPLGSSVGHERAGLLSVTGHVLLTVDSSRRRSPPLGSLDTWSGSCSTPSTCEASSGRRFEAGTTDGVRWFDLDEITNLPHVEIVDFVVDLLA